MLAILMVMPMYRCYSYRTLFFIAIILVFCLSRNSLPVTTYVVGHVERIQPHSIIIYDNYQGYRVNGSYDVSIGDTVQVDGNFETIPITSERVVYSVSNAKLIKTETSMGIRSWIWNRVKHSSILQHVLYGIGSDVHDWRVLVSVHISGFLLLVYTFFRRWIGTYRALLMNQVLSCVIVLAFGFRLSTARLVLKSFLPIHAQIILILTLFPNSLLTPTFIMCYGVELIHGIGRHWERLSPTLVRFMFYQALFYRNNIIEHLCFRWIRYIYGLVYAFAILALLCPGIENIALSLMNAIESNLNSAFTNRFAIVGELHGMLAIGLILLYRQMSHKQFCYTLLLVSIFIVYNPFYRVTFIDVGQGDATLVQYPFNSYTTLIDTGKASAKYKLLKALTRQGVVNVNQLVITHPDNDHNGNQEFIEQRFHLKAITHKTEPVVLADTILDKQSFPKGNENSRILVLPYNVLITGDAYQSQEEIIAKNHLVGCLSVLKLGHHGSKTSTSDILLDATRPKYVVISSKKSTYGHPHQQVLRKLHNRRIPYLHTETHGDITIYINSIFHVVLTKKHTFDIIEPVIKC